MSHLPPKPVTSYANPSYPAPPPARRRSRSPDYSRGGGSYRPRSRSPPRVGRGDYSGRGGSSRDDYSNSRGGGGGGGSYRGDRDRSYGYQSGGYDDRDRVPPPRRYDPTGGAGESSYPSYDRDRDYHGSGSGSRGQQHYDQGGASYQQYPEQQGYGYNSYQQGGGGERWDRGQNIENSYYDPNDPYSYQDPSYSHQYDQSGPRQRSNKQPSEVSRDVIFLGLDPMLDEAGLLEYLRSQHNASIDTTTIIKDKVTGLSKGYGFALFSTQSGAEEFVGRNFPHIHIPANPAVIGSQPTTSKIDYSASTNPTATGPGGSKVGGEASTSIAMGTGAGAWGAGVGGGGSGADSWSAELGVGGARSARGGRGGALGVNDGMRDIGTPGGGNRVLLIRGLDVITPAEEIRDRFGSEVVRLAQAQAQQSSSAPIPSDGRPAIKRIVIIKDRFTKTSLGFGFIELATSDLATSLLAHLLSKEAQPFGFVINDRPIACSFANTKAFIDAGESGGTAHWCIGGGREGGIGGKDGWMKYWDEAAGASELVVKVPTTGPQGNNGVDIELLSFLQSIKTPASEELAKPAATGSASTIPAVGQGLISGGKMQPLKIGLGGKRKEKDMDVLVPLPIPEAVRDGNVLGGDDDDDVEPDQDSVLASRSELSTGSKGFFNAELHSISKNINKWNTKQGELKADLDAVNSNSGPAGMSSVNSTLSIKPLVKAPQAQIISATPTSAASASASPAPEASTSNSKSGEIDYADSVKMACLLCQRQFKSLDILGRHTNESELHKKNLLDPTICEAGLKRKNATAGPSTSSPSAATTETQVYRDRAAERRTVFNQPSIPLPEASRPNPKRKFAEGPVAPPPVERPVPGLEPAKDEKNVGNQMLKKMGWTEGMGLGAEGTGRVDPVQALLYQERAGLGAGKARDPTLYQGVDGYKNMTKDGARNRYNESS